MVQREEGSRRKSLSDGVGCSIGKGRGKYIREDFNRIETISGRKTPKKWDGSSGYEMAPRFSRLPHRNRLGDKGATSLTLQ